MNSRAGPRNPLNASDYAPYDNNEGRLFSALASGGRQRLRERSIHVFRIILRPDSCFVPSSAMKPTVFAPGMPQTTEGVSH